MRTAKFSALLAAISGVVIAGSAGAATYTVNAASGTLAWNSASTWTPNSGFPNAGGDVASLNSDITATTTLNLNQAITIGTLNIGDLSGGSSFNINTGTGTNTLTLASAVAGASTYINVGNTATSSNTINAAVALGGSSLLALATSTSGQTLTTAGTFTTNGNNISVSGGILNTHGWTITGDLLGGGTITYGGAGGINVSGTKSFTGTIVLNSGRGGSTNSGSMTATTGSVRNADEIIINGYIPQGQGLQQNGGSFHSGNSSAQTTNPGQRVTQGIVTLNGGSINLVGQTATVGTANPWQQGLEKVVDTTASLNLNSGYSLILTGASATTAGTRWNIGTVGRTAGATGYIRSSVLGTTARITAGNGTGLAIGGGGAAGTTTMSIIPWMVANNTNGSGQNGAGFAVYDTTLSGGEVVGFRALVSPAEYATTVTAGSTANINTSTLTLASDATVNSILHPSSGVSNIGAGRTLTVASGGIIFTVNNGGIGAAGNAAAGTLNFGTAEGVIWARGDNGTTLTNSIGSVITGSGGLTKAGTGILVLAGANNYTGKTTVSAGTLQVGNGTQTSILASAGDVEVANGATLSLLNSDAIADNATVTLDNYGLFNGKMNLAAGVTDTVAALYFGGAAQASGTYGSTSSSATYKNDTYFSGTGVLNVVAIPEPATIALLSIGSLVLLRRRHA